MIPGVGHVTLELGIVSLRLTVEGTGYLYKNRLKITKI